MVTKLEGQSKLLATGCSLPMGTKGYAKMVLNRFHNLGIPSAIKPKKRKYDKIQKLDNIFKEMKKCERSEHTMIKK